MANEKKMDEAIKYTVNYCMNNLNFADPKWDDKNFPDYKEAKEEKADSDTNK